MTSPSGEVRQSDKERKPLCCLAFIMGKTWKVRISEERLQFEVCVGRPSRYFLWCSGKPARNFTPGKPWPWPGSRVSRQLNRDPHVESSSLSREEKMPAECYCPGNLISAAKRQMPNKEGRWYAAKSRLKGALCQIFSGGFLSGVGGYPNPTAGLH